MTIEEDLGDIVGNACTLRTLQSGETLFYRGSPTEGLFEVVSGSVRLTRVDPNGKEAVLHVARAGDPLAEASIFTPVYHCDATAMTKSVVRLYPKGLLLSHFEGNPTFAKAYTLMLARQLMDARTRVQCLSMHSARDRIRHFLVLNTCKDGLTVELPGTLKDLSAELGLTHEVLYRTLVRMVEDGEIARSGRTIMLLSPVIT
ncbi:Crp/Fnr family transcriptional regulator [Rhodomicrobium lacus]|uniref:Crp/Fnr family transcriptional regulator n=1 Tax=Rhodomicrobium lacus TaxID=2498452 RepID=UPI0026E1A4C9|nr:Crp/Fnr family transcriptional regulator [Rhodomicrobium lacus]WKW51252.1 Crp/Fnr family transcriptional regulator [Rhodomicrobium lacus]